MSFPLVLLLAVAVLLALAVAFAAGVVVGALRTKASARAAIARAEAANAAANEAAVSAAVAAVLAERDATAAAVTADRERTVHSAVDTVIKVAGSELQNRLATGEQALDLRAQAFEQRVHDLSSELKRVTDLVARLQQERAQQHGEVVQRLDQAAAATSALAQTAQGLREVLASPKTRGQWGERMADDVLRAAGFVEGLNYRRQQTLDGGRRPDFTFLLPQDVELNMDVKFPIDNYVRYLEATTDAERDAARTAFVRDVRNRVKEITGREYIDPSRTVDHVLLFIPNEAIYSFIHESDAELLDRALASRVVLCSPSTLFAVLAVVRQSTRQFLFERTSTEILECLTRFVKQWDKFADQVDKVGRHLDTLSSSFDDLRGTRRRQLERELDRIEMLQSRHDVAAAANDDGGDWPTVRELRAG
jgi:DNA recombination protein RmuC